MELLQRARESGRVIPSLVAVDNGTIEVDGFGADLLGLLDGAGTLAWNELMPNSGFHLQSAHNLLCRRRFLP
jgi:hypothetical protein